MTREIVPLIVPDHVPPRLVLEYDYFHDRRFETDLQRGVHKLHSEAPDVFFSPCNGGFWVVTRLPLQERVLKDTTHFSNAELDIPKSGSPYKMIPLNLDPPEHLPYRMAIMRHFDQKRIRAMEPNLRQWANRLIDRVIDKGSCEFVEEVGAAFPVSVFFELMGLPFERFEEFREIVKEFFGNTTLARRIALQKTIMDLMIAEFDKRRTSPKNDLMSVLVHEEIKGRPINREELEAIGFLLFIAGLDTVANTLSFTFRQLALHPELQARLASDPACSADFVEEALRRCSIVQQTRLVKQDYVFEGAPMKAGDMVNCPLALAGMDELANPNPEKIDIDRQSRAHLAFSAGPHVCIGNFLARMEMKVLTEEWIRRIPSFWVKPGTEAQWRAGGVMALHNVWLEWHRP